MDGRDLGEAFARMAWTVLVGGVIVGGVSAIVLWELFWWLWSHLVWT